MKVLKIRLKSEIEIAQIVEDSAPVGSILEDMNGDPAYIEEIKKEWAKNLGAAGKIINFELLEAGIVEV